MFEVTVWSKFNLLKRLRTPNLMFYSLLFLTSFFMTLTISLSLWIRRNFHHNIHNPTSPSLSCFLFNSFVPTLSFLLHSFPILIQQLSAINLHPCRQLLLHLCRSPIFPLTLSFLSSSFSFPSSPLLDS